MRHGQRPQQQGVDEPERAGAGADAQRQRQDGRRGSHLILLQLPPAENRIGAQRIEPSDKPDVATLLSQSQGGAERSPCFGRVAALLDRFFDFFKPFAVTFDFDTMQIFLQ